MIYFVAFISTFFLSIFFTLLVKKIALKLEIVDIPIQKRKIHEKATSLLGGVAVFFSFSLVVIFLGFFTDQLLGGYLLSKHIIGIILGGLILIIGGILDDKLNLRPRIQIIFPILAAIIIIISGIGISYISNPFGDSFDLTQIRFEFLRIGDLPYYFVLLADVLTFLWLLGMTYTTKILDGLDGLVSGLTVIAGLAIFFLSLQENVMQPETALLAIVLVGSFSGFLIFNFYPAKIFLGEGGSTFAGFMIGTLAIISGGKLATALLVFSIPIIDLGFVIFERIFKKQKPFSTSDTKHVHFRLLELGFSKRKTVVLFYAFAAMLSAMALVLEGKAKVMALVAIGLITMIALVTIAWRIKK